MRHAIHKLAHAISLPALLALVIGLNIYWSVMLNSFERQFVAQTGAPLLDLQNVESILTGEEALQLISQYSAEARTLYWQFFVMDGIMPPLVFGVFVLLWVRLLAPLRYRWSGWLLDSYLLLIPLGVGLFDWIENLFFLVAINPAPTSDPLLLLQIGLGFVWLKAACLFTTFIGSGLLLLVRVGTAVARLHTRLLSSKPTG